MRKAIRQSVSLVITNNQSIALYKVSSYLFNYYNERKKLLISAHERMPVT